MPSFAPQIETVSDEALLPLVMLLGARRPLVAITGAGISTESGIPDYRSPGKERKKPMDGRLFNASADARQRYWARGFFGFTPVQTAMPNRGHLALASLERAHLCRGVITQNVDGLHRRAKTAAVVELHGTLSNVRCLQCDAVEARAITQLRMEVANPSFAAQKASRDSAEANSGIESTRERASGSESARARSSGSDVEQLPDGDVALATAQEQAFVPPTCVHCDGPLKPDVIFHGECMPTARRQHARDLIAEAGAVLVVGSSLAVESARALVRQATRQRTPVAIVNVGPTAADAEAQVVVHGSAGDVLHRLAHALQPNADGFGARDHSGSALG